VEYFLEHLRKDHLLSSVDARVKLFVSVVILAMVLSHKGFVLSLIVTSLCLFLSVMMRIPLRVLALRFLEPLFITCITLILKCFFSGSEVLFSFSIFGFSIAGHRDGLTEGLLIAVRIIGSVSVLIVLGFSMPFTELMAGLSWFRVPRGFVEILMFAYRYLFNLFEDAAVISTAQKNRLGYSSLRRGLSSFGTLAGSLTIRAFERSHDTTVAMIQRGYDGSVPMLRHKPFRSSEILGSAVFLLVMGLVWKM
jgi:cobalt/nickel transport system permease protein